MISPLDKFGLQEDEEHENDLWAHKINEKINEVIDHLNKDNLKEKLVVLIESWKKEAVEWQRKHEEYYLKGNDEKKAIKASFMSFGILKCCEELREIL
jgi:DUF4097 and DUF4098 domain-containing protein YvlB